MLPFRYRIGLEIHVELSTATKMFCRCKNDPFGSQPNQHTCPVCLGLPGTLPVPNKEAVRKTVLIGKALGSEINKLSKWDRKHYFYPDLPKGYQVSQYDQPFCIGGGLDLLDKEGAVSAHIRFNRIHLEEDAGKLMHTGKKGFSKVDLNRAGVPLAEMVTEPDLTSPEQARAFLQELRLLARTLGISDADMEKGQMRCDVNISIWIDENGTEINTPVTEVKNVNSTRAVERSITVEAQRQYDEWMAKGPIRTRKNKLTASWDEDKNEVSISRAKEAANEYRYFPEPDLPPVEVYAVPELNPDKMVLPELPNQRRLRYLELGLNMSDIEVLLSDPERLERFEGYLSDGLPAKQVANWLINAAESQTLSKKQFAELIELVASGEVAFAAAKAKLSELTAAKGSIRETATKLGLIQKHDEAAVNAAIKAVLAEQEKVVAEYKAGNERLLGFLVGQVMKRAAGQAQPAKVQEAVKAALK